MNRNINIVVDSNGDRIVVINDILFKGKQNIKWEDVEVYLKQYVGDFYSIASTNEVVYIGKDLPDEYAHSVYTRKLKGGSAKAKANAVQGLPELIQNANGREYKANKKEKHSKDAKFGWYRYQTKFALPIYNQAEQIENYNIFCAMMLIRWAKDGKKYLYDIVEIKKETGKLFRSDDFTQ